MLLRLLDLLSPLKHYRRSDQHRPAGPIRLLPGLEADVDAAVDIQTVQQDAFADGCDDAIEH